MSKPNQVVRFKLSDPDAEKKGLLILGCRYDVILRVAMENNFTGMSEEDKWTLCWSDVPLPLEKINSMRTSQVFGGLNAPAIQKINHFPGMYEICRKDRLCRNLNKLKRVFRRDYNFFPSTWDLPADMAELMEYGKGHKDTTYIIKPDSGSQGKGIFLVRSLKMLCPFAQCVCQLYISEPFLIDGYKFDQRIYVLVTCVDPLRFYIHGEGLARFATVKYELPTEENMEITYMHLTNYSLNKMSEAFDSRADNGTKRPMSEIYEFMLNRGYDVQKLKDDIDDIVIKTIVGVAPSLRHSYRATYPKREKGCCCFEVLGFDILVDRNLKPFLLEVNHSPSFNLDTNIDSFVKFQVVRDVFSILYLGQETPTGERHNVDKFNIQRKPGTCHESVIPDTLKDQFAHEENSVHDWRLIFSEENPGKYAKYMDKEYVLKDYKNELFVKKKPEPCMHDGCSHSFFKGAGSLQTQTSLRKTSYGQVYVESRTPTPPQYDHNEFLKFKYNEQLSEAARSKKRQNNSARFQRNNFVLPLQDISEKDKMTQTKLDGGTSGRYVSDNNSRPKSRSGSAVSETIVIPKLKLQVVSPSRRVQNALELLRQSNVENFKAAVKDANFNRYYPDLNGSASAKRDISPYLSAKSWTALNNNGRPAKIISARPSTEGRILRDNKNEADGLLFLDHAKLPSVIKHAMKATQLQRDETTRVTNSGKDLTSSYSRHFKPLQIRINEELDNLKKSQKEKLRVEMFGVGATAQKVVEMVSANSN